MCSVFKYNNCVGRNFDYQVSYDEEAIFVPSGEELFNNEYPIIGIGSGLFDSYPMYYDAMNNQGLFVAGLAFEGNAKYHSYDENKVNLAPYEVIPKILGKYKSVDEFMNDVENGDLLNIVDKPFDYQTDNSELHWFVCDKKDCIVIESTDNGVKASNNSFGVLTNNPPFEVMSAFVKFRMNIMNNVADSDFCKKFFSGNFSSRGTETYNLGGGYTSIERFERLAFLKRKIEKNSFLDFVDDSFKLLDSVEQLYGVTSVGEQYEYTIYKAVYDLENLELYTRRYSEVGYYPCVLEFNEESNKIERCSI